MVKVEHREDRNTRKRPGRRPPYCSLVSRKHNHTAHELTVSEQHKNYASPDHHTQRACHQPADRCSKRGFPIRPSQLTPESPAETDGVLHTVTVCHRDRQCSTHCNQLFNKLSSLNSAHSKHVCSDQSAPQGWPLRRGGRDQSIDTTLIMKRTEQRYST